MFSMQSLESRLLRSGGASDLIRSNATLSIARNPVAAVAVAGKAYFGGGATAVLQDTTRLDIYNSVTGLWTFDELHLARSMHVAAKAGTQAAFAGGVSIVQENHVRVVDRVTAARKDDRRAAGDRYGGACWLRPASRNEYSDIAPR